MKKYIKPATTARELRCKCQLLTASQFDITVNDTPLGEGEGFDE